jgi:hypothetical protein
LSIGNRRVKDFVVEPDALRRILEHVGLAAEVPRVEPARTAGTAVREGEKEKIGRTESAAGADLPVPGGRTTMPPTDGIRRIR